MDNAFPPHAVLPTTIQLLALTLTTAYRAPCDMLLDVGVGRDWNQRWTHGNSRHTAPTPTKKSSEHLKQPKPF